ncbi:acyl-CoA thioesterase [Flavobacterium sp. J372]|uniref:acyl-CoA thioesterase n=1 Tax=Flavobacterium sp. J372 TaxID=2898436 RepID=UPI002151252C|nr:acyl-CoA thioesterase [Flavobacterium sp. J372]MCR5863126.1 acyl-CoA thioesterase [Flavobacterium sp. J372]
MEEKIYKKVSASKVTISELMLPSHTNFSGKIHGGYILMLMDQIAFASASKFSGMYCVTASVDTVDFLNPIEVGEIVTMKASVNYVGNSSMIVGIRVTSENIRTGMVKHCNSSYFTMVAKDDNGKNAMVPRLILSSLNEVRRFYNALKRINLKKEKNLHEETFDHTTGEALEGLKNHDIRLNL